MTKHRKPFLTDFASEFRKVGQANAEFADLVRGLEYPDVLARIRNPPVPLHLVLAGLLSALLFVAVRLPLRILKRFGAANAAALLSIGRDLCTELRGDILSIFTAAVDACRYAWHWLRILGSCLRIEVKILGHHILIGALLAVLYAALVASLVWLVLFVLGA